ncbi:unnamed protein product [Anisakis simplex]|uniref:Dopamine receptor 1 (inferred by orthology to a D. melanogaster protein) n=1 Tax=Anisakis simplex TaxID=6269 RepID=A0A0M3JWT1_ANISI|nr:unnamed protein product [Anisakis simplex]
MRNRSSVHRQEVDDEKPFEAWIFVLINSTTFLLVLFTILIVLSLSGNLLVCASVYLDRKLRKQAENLFLVSLALSDLFVSVLVMIFAAANDLLGYWPFGRIYCQLWICSDIACCTASILNLCAIAFYRYLNISRPMFYVSSSPSHYLPKCQLLLKPIYAIGSSMCSFFVPATIMLSLYTKLYLYARRHVRSIRSQLKQATGLLIMQIASDRVREPSFRLTLGFIMGTFLVCWLPFFIVNVLRSLIPEIVTNAQFQVVVTFISFEYIFFLKKKRPKVIFLLIQKNITRLQLGHDQQTH